MEFENVREVEVKAVNGRVRIEGWENDHVEVNYTLHGDVEVEVEQVGKKLVVKERLIGKKLLGFIPKPSEGWAEIELRLPKGTVVNFRNVNGELEAREVALRKASTVNGRISLENCEAQELSTVNGRIRAHLSVAGPLKASTVNGELEITIEELEGDVEASCVNGNIVLRLTDFCDASIETKKANGDVKFVGIDPNEPVIGTGEFTVKVSTANGSVRVELI